MGITFCSKTEMKNRFIFICLEIVGYFHISQRCYSFLNIGICRFLVEKFSKFKINTLQ